jgi:spermidine synthase
MVYTCVRHAPHRRISHSRSSSLKPLRTVESVDTADGVLALKQRGERDFLITVDGRVLMSSSAHRSEVALGALAAARVASVDRPRILVGGLGMGFTLRAVLDQLPARSSVVVAELNPITEAWCRGPLAHLTDHAVTDPRVTVEIADVTKVIVRAATAGGPSRFDAIVIDLYVGPDAGTQRTDPLYGTRAVAQAFEALKPGGLYGVWGEAFDVAYAKRLEGAGFTVRHERPGKGGLRHVVYVAQKPTQRERSSTK